MSIFYLKVGALGFEPRTSWSQTMRAKPDCATPRVNAGKQKRYFTAYTALGQNNGGVGEKKG